MANILEALYSRLSGQSAVTDLIGTRLYPVPAPQNASLPFATFQRVSTTRGREVANGPNGLVRTRVQFDVYDTVETGGGRASVLAVANAVRGALDGFRGTVAGVEIKQIIVEDDRDLYDDASGLARANFDALIFHDE